MFLEKKYRNYLINIGWKEVKKLINKSLFEKQRKHIRNFCSKNKGSI